MVTSVRQISSWHQAAHQHDILYLGTSSPLASSPNGPGIDVPFNGRMSVGVCSVRIMSSFEDRHDIRVFRRLVRPGSPRREIP
jgi:hypothetical protein